MLICYRIGSLSPEQHLMFGGIALSIAIILIFLPDIIWRIYERWGYTADTEPSDTFLLKCRIVGIGYALLAVYDIYWFVERTY